MQTVLVTGANGFIGYYIVNQLLQKDYKVIATGKGSCRLPFTHPCFTYQTLDFTQEQAVKEMLIQTKPDIIIHGGAISKPDVCEEDKDLAYNINVTGTQLLLQYAMLVKSFFVFISTDFVFNGEQEVYTEEDAPEPVNYYGETKWLAEKAVQNYPFSWSIVRPVLVYGKPVCGRQNILTNVAAALQKGESLHIYTDQQRTPTYVEDLVRGITTIVDKKATGIFHMSGEDVLSPYDMAVSVAHYLGLNKNLISPATAQTFSQPAKRPPKTKFNLAKAKQQLQYTVTPFGKGLQKTFEV